MSTSQKRKDWGLGRTSYHFRAEDESAPYLPTEKEINEGREFIQSTWSEEVERNRAEGRDVIHVKPLDERDDKIVLSHGGVLED